MKILFLTPWYPDERSPNSGAFIRSQALALQAENQVVVISSKVDYSKFSLCSFSITETDYAEIKEYRLLVNRSLPLYNLLNYLLVTCWVTYTIARKFKPAIIHSNIGFPGGIWGWCVSKIFGCPFIFTEHTRITNNFRSFFHKTLTIFSVKRAKCRIAVSRSLAREIEIWIKHQCFIIPNIVEVNRFKNVKTSNETIPQIGFLGGMNLPVKGLDILLKSLVGIQRDFILHIGGSGVMEQEYKTLTAALGLSTKCRFYGFIQPGQVPDFMSRLHFLVCSSRYETFNVSLTEAMACGMPVVATKCGGPEDFVNKNNGILVEPNNENELREGLIWMMDNYHSFDANPIKQFVTDNFSSAAFLERINACYAQALS